MRNLPFSAFFLLFLLIALPATPGCVRVRGNTSLRTEIEAERGPGGAGSTVSTTYLYDSYTKVSRVGNVSISPDGNFAAFDLDGRLMLYRRGSNTLREVTDRGFAIPKTFSWNIERGELFIVYFPESVAPDSPVHPPSTIRLVL